MARNYGSLIANMCRSYWMESRMNKENCSNQDTSSILYSGYRVCVCSLLSVYKILFIWTLVVAQSHI